MRSTGKIDWSAAAIWLIGLSLPAFVSFKAATSSFTHDESFTTLHFFPQGEGDILFYRHPFTSVITNNHILNTLLMKLSESLFGLSEWALRLPNILALIIYLFFGALLCRRLPVPWMRFFSFSLLVANPYLIDFFGVARGYGLSIGMMMGSCYYLLSSNKTPEGKLLFGFHLFGILSVMSNFALLNFYIAALGCLYFLPFWQEKPWPVSFLKNWKLHVWNTLALLIMSALLYAPFKVILENNTVSFGGKEGFFSNTVRSVVARSLYESPASETAITILGLLACLMVLGSFVLVGWKTIKRQTEFFKKYRELVVINTICWLIPLMTIVQHYLFGQDYLAERFAIFLYPLFALNLIYLNQWLWDWSKVTSTVFSALVFGIFMFNTVRNLNDEFYLNWKYDKDTKAVMELLQDYRPADGSSRKIGIFHQLEPSMNLYRRWWEMYWIEEFNREPPTPDHDFIFTLESELGSLGIDRDQEVLFRSPETGMILLKNR